MPDNYTPKQLWQNQPTEKPTMTLKLIQKQSRQLRATTRIKLLGTVVGPTVVGLLYIYSMKVFTAFRGTLEPLFVLALLWSLAGLYILNRGMWSTDVPEASGISTGLEFCRLEIEKQRNLLRRNLVWMFAPIVVAVGAVVWALVLVSTRERGIYPNGLPFLIAIAVWIAGYFVARVREERALQREVSELSELQNL